MLGWFGFKRTAADPPVVRSRIASERRRKYVCYTLVALATLGILKSVPFPQDLRPWAAPAFAEYVVCMSACVRFCVRVRFLRAAGAAGAAAGAAVAGGGPHGSGLRNAVAFQSERTREREAADEARRQEMLEKMKGEWRPSLSAAISGTQGSAREKLS